MKTLRKYFGVLSILLLPLLLLTGENAQAGRGGNVTVTPSANLPYVGPCSTLSSTPYVVLRTADDGEDVASYNLCDLSMTSPEGVTVTQSDTISGCSDKPWKCPSAVVFVGVVEGIYTVSLEMRDTLYQSSNGLQGKSTVLGYYTTVRTPAESTENITDRKRAAVLRIDESHRSHKLLLRIH